MTADQRQDLELRAAIERVDDPQAREALALMQRRVAWYARRNWNRIGWLMHRTFVILAVLAGLWMALGVVSGLLVAQNDRRNHDVRTLGSQLCAQARTDRRTLEQQWKNTSDYLASPAGMAHTGLNDYIRNRSFPQLKKRLATERVPSACSHL
jgi:hypothetical protein